MLFIPKKVFASWLHGGERNLRKFIQQPLYVPEAMHTQSLLDMFKVKRIKVALVMDEFGGLAGMVTLRDVIEHLVGDLPSYDEDVKQEIVKRDDGSWLVDGMLPVSEFKDYFEFEELPLEEKTAIIRLPGLWLQISGIFLRPAITLFGKVTVLKLLTWTVPALIK